MDSYEIFLKHLRLALLPVEPVLLFRKPMQSSQVLLLRSISNHIS